MASIAILCFIAGGRCIFFHPKEKGLRTDLCAMHYHPYYKPPLMVEGTSEVIPEANTGLRSLHLQASIKLLKKQGSPTFPTLQTGGWGRRDGSTPTTRRNGASYVSVRVHRSRRWSCAHLPTRPSLSQPASEGRSLILGHSPGVGDPCPKRPPNAHILCLSPCLLKYFRSLFGVFWIPMYIIPEGIVELLKGHYSIQAINPATHSRGL